MHTWRAPPGPPIPGQADSVHTLCELEGDKATILACSQYGGEN